MRCTSYCTAGSYQMKELVEMLASKGLEPKYFDDVVHVQKEYGKSNPVVDIFYFPFGCMTIWGAEESAEKDLVTQIKKLEVDRNAA